MMKIAENTQIHGKNTGKALEILSNDSIKIPVGTTAQRPANPETGMLRLNTTIPALEYYNGTTWQQIPISSLFQLLSEKGAANGYAPLDSNGVVPSINLPSYVDDILEFADLASFPAMGESGKIYLDLTTNKQYRWGGTSYIDVSGGAVMAENGVKVDPSTKKVELGGRLLKNTEVSDFAAGFDFALRASHLVLQGFLGLTFENCDRIIAETNNDFIIRGLNSGEDIFVLEDGGSAFLWAQQNLELQGDNFIRISSGGNLLIEGTLPNGTFNSGNAETDITGVVMQSSSGRLVKTILAMPPAKHSETTSLVAGVNTITHNLNLPNGAERDFIVQAIEIGTGNVVVISNFTAFNSNSFTFNHPANIANVRITVIG